MGLNDYVCDDPECGFKDEYFSAVDSLPKEMQAPENCPKCQKGKLVRQFNPTGRVYVPRNWKEGLSVEKQAELLNPDPGSGKYKNPY